MFRAMLMTQWKWSKWPLLAMTLLGFTIPVLSVQRAGLAFGSAFDRFGSGAVLSSIEFWSLGYPLLAAFGALVIAAIAWGWDEKGKHVYALSLPVARWHYALLRLGAGAVLLVAPIMAVTLGALLAVSAATIPPGTTAHPLALAFRFALALAVAYATFFALAAGGDKFGRYLAGAVIGIFVLHIVFGMLQIGDVLMFVGDKLIQWPGPLQIFTGRWMLIDV